jgi:heptosyltransferase-3
MTFNPDKAGSIIQDQAEDRGPGTGDREKIINSFVSGPPSPVPYQRILVINLKHLGDVLLITPVLTALKEAWPQCRLSVLVRRGCEDMLSGNPSIDELLIVETQGQPWWHPLQFARSLRQHRFDLVLALSEGDRGAIYTWISRAAVRIGFDYPACPAWQRHLAFNHFLPRPPVRGHMVDYNLAAVRALGLEPQDTRLRFYWDEAVEQRIRKLMEQNRLAAQSFVLIHPPARWLFKGWTPAGYARVIDTLQKDYRIPVVLTAAPVEQEMQLMNNILEQVNSRPINLSGRLTLKELGALIAKARLFFGVDSAPMHLAAAVGTPAVALFGPSGDFNWRPWGEGHTVIKKGWDCQPCGRDGCEGTKVSRCLTEITPEEVLAAIDKLVTSHQSSVL